MNKLIPILHNIRSLHNIGSILRTCDGLGITEVWVSGITPYPQLENDTRLPHISKRATKQINKTALGAEKNLLIRHFGDTPSLLTEVTMSKLKLIAVEQTKDSKKLDDFRPSGNQFGLVFGNEVDGIDQELLDKCSSAIEIPMRGKKESFNVSITVAIVLYTMTKSAKK